MMSKRLKVCESREEVQAVYDIGALLWRYGGHPVLRDWSQIVAYNRFAYFVEEDDEVDASPDSNKGEI